MGPLCSLSFKFFFAVLSVACSPVVTNWDRADLLALLYVMFSCVLVILPYAVIWRDVVFDCIDS